MSSFLEWIIKNQFGRRNLSLMDRSRLALRLEDVYRERAKENKSAAGGNHGNQYTGGKEAVHQKSDKPAHPVNTLKEIAKIAGVSHDTMHKAKVIEREGNQHGTTCQKSDNLFPVNTLKETPLSMVTIATRFAPA